MLAANINLVVACIRLLRAKIRHPIDALSAFPLSGTQEVLRQNKNIITDACVYAILITSPSLAQKDLLCHPILKLLQDRLKGNAADWQPPEKVCIVRGFLQQLHDFLHLPSLAPDRLEKIFQNSQLKQQPPIALALRIYLLKGHFQWVDDRESVFPAFILDEKHSHLPSDAKINCWEAVLYALLTSGCLSRKDLQKLYRKSPQSIERALREWFDFPHASVLSRKGHAVENWQQKLSNEAHFIMMGKAWGMKHDMLSLPYSQKQILAMLLTEQFELSPAKPKLFSHWEYWTGGKLGSVSKINFQEELYTSDNDVRCIPIQSFQEKSREFMQD